MFGIWIRVEGFNERLLKTVFLVTANTELNQDEQNPVDASKKSKCILNCIPLEGSIGHTIVRYDGNFEEPFDIRVLRVLDRGRLAWGVRNCLCKGTSQFAQPTVWLKEERSEVLSACLSNFVPDVLSDVFDGIYLHERFKLIEIIRE